MSRRRDISEVYEGEVPESRRKSFSKFSNMDRRKKQAVWASIKEQQKFPRALWGTSHSLRGTPANLAKFGATYKSATPEQRSMRSSKGYSGKGLYRGKGGFWGDIGRNIGQVFGGGHGDLMKSFGGIGACLVPESSILI